VSSEAEAMMVRVGMVLAVVAGLALTGCASTSRAIPGLTSGPLPEPKPFVVATRPPQSNEYPVIGHTPPPRAEKPMTPAEVAKLEADLDAAAGIRKKRKLPPPPVQPQ